MKMKWLLIFFAVLIASFIVGIFWRGCEEARGAEMRQEFRVLVKEFNKIGQELTKIKVRVDNLETVFRMGIDVLKDISLSEEERLFCADEVNMDFNRLIVAGKNLKSVVIEMEKVFNEIKIFKTFNSGEEEIKGKFIALGEDMLGRARELNNNLEKYDAEFQPF